MDGRWELVSHILLVLYFSASYRDSWTDLIVRFQEISTDAPLYMKILLLCVCIHIYMYMYTHTYILYICIYIVCMYIQMFYYSLNITA